MRKNFRRKLQRAATAAARLNMEPLESRVMLSAVSWVNAYSGNWDTPGNWSTGVVPDAASDVYIDQPGFIVITVQGPHTVANVSVQGDTLKISTSSLTVTGAVNDNGSINLEYGSQLSVMGGVGILAGAQLNLAGGGAGGSTLSAGAISNSGKISIGGSNTVAAGAGGFSQAAIGNLAVELGGSPAGNQFGKLTVAGAAALAGTFEASLANGDSPSVGDTFGVMTYGSETGAFSAFQVPADSWYGFQPDFNAARLQLTALSPSTPTTNVNVGAVVRTVTTDFLGVNSGWWDSQLLTPQTKQLVQDAGLKVFRFPGGGSSDGYHFDIPDNYRADATTIPQYAQFIESVGGAGLVTMDYGSGSPQEAEAELAYLTGSATDTTTIGTGFEWNDAAGQWQNVDWKSVSYWAGLRASAPLAVDDGLNFMRINHAAAFSNMKWWEVGNELYGGWETDHHGTNLPDGTPTGAAHDPLTYVQFAAQFAQFVAADQGRLPSISIGIDSWDPSGAADNNWTRQVLVDGRNLGFVPGFISDHSYAQSPGSENDYTLLNNTVSDPNSAFDYVTRYGNYEALLTQTLGSQASLVNVMATEYNSVTNNPGKQLSSLVNGLFLADSMGSMITSGYTGGMVWALRDYYSTGFNNGGWLYGWRQGGDYGLLGDPNVMDAPSTGANIAYPSYFAEQLASKIVQAGGQVVSTVSSNTQLSAYAVLEADGHLKLLVINKNGGAAVTQRFNVAGFTPGASLNVWQYGMTQDNAQSQSATGASALANFSAAISVANGGFTYTLPAYSMSVLDLSPAVIVSPPTVATAAAVAPNPVTGTTAALSVLGADASGESHLAYLWSVTTVPSGVLAPTFSVNGTNGAKNTTATFYGAGTYTFAVTMRVAGGPSTVSSVNVTVNSTLAQIQIGNAVTRVGSGSSTAFTAVVQDQFGNTYANPPAVTWSVLGGGVGGTMSTAGVYTAPSDVSGVATIAATIGAGGGAVQGTLAVNVVNGAFNVINLPNGFASAGGLLVTNGAAEVTGSNLVLIDDTYNQSASAYFAGKVNVARFSTQFNFHLNNAWPMGNGFTFVIQNSGLLALGQSNTGLGYGPSVNGGGGGIGNSVAIKFDLYNTYGSGSTGLYTNGSYPGVNGSELGRNGFNLRSWDPSQATITYDGTTLNVTLLDLYTQATESQSYVVNIPGMVGGNTAWVGFTASSGFQTAAQAITSWTYSNTFNYALATPMNVMAAAGNGQVALTWNAAAGTAGYSVAQATSLGGPYTTVATDIADASYTVPGLTNGQAYYFQVSGMSGGFASLASTAVSATPVAAPAAPTGLTLTAGNGAVGLTWNLVAGAASYLVAKSTLSGGPYTVFAAGLTTTNATAVGLTNGQTYYFVVYASNSSGPSGASGQMSATPNAVPDVPAGLAATSGNGQAALAWNAAAGALSYTVKYGTASGNYTSTLAGITGTSATISPLSNGTLYYFIVIAVNALGNSGNSGEASTTPSNAPPLVVRIVDDNDAGYSAVGNWGSTFEAGVYFNGDHSFAKSGNGADAATYTFSGLIPGIYRVAATWRGDTNRVTAAPYTIYDGGSALGTVFVNQQLSPNSFADQGSHWGTLGNFSLTGSTLKVTLRDTADAALYVDADAVRIERIGDLVSGPVVQVLDGTNALISGATVNFGSTTPGTPAQRTFTVENAGTTTLNLAAITLPPGYSLAADFGSSALAPSASTTFKVQLDAATAGTFSGALTFTTNDSATPTFTMNLAGTAAAAPPPAVVRIIDDGDAGFSTAGTWGSSVEAGRYYGNDHSFAKSGNGADAATYTFTGLTPGVYRVAATWRGDTNRATAAPFTIADNGTVVGTVTINQQQMPASFTDAGSSWGDLGTYNITSSTLIVTLRDTNDASLYVDADAVRIERVGDLGFTPPPPNPVFIVDDRGSGWSSVGTWGNTVEPGRYYGDGHSFAIGGQGADAATWTFSGLTPGKYRVWTTWRGDTNRATNAPFTILDGSTALATVVIDQQNAPSGLSDQGVNWTELGGPYAITGSTLSVRLTDNADLYVDADAVRIERIGD